MSAGTFIEMQIAQIQQGGRAVLFRKMKRALQILPKLSLYIVAAPFAIPVVLVLRIIRPWLLLRWGGMTSMRIGHFAANTEMYLCERDAGINVAKQNYLDLFYMAYRPICNLQLATMWKRVLRAWPFWILAPISRVNRLIPGGSLHEIGNNTQHDRDVHNLLDRFPPHLKFTPEEEASGEASLRAFGIPYGARFVCLTVRDSAYLDAHIRRDWSYHSYRDSDIQNYILAAEELADRGYYVIRMGAKVMEAMKITHPKVIDYATNGMRSDFMDIYLGAKCDFCISTGMGLDAIPTIFRRPIVYINLVPLGYLHTFRTEFISITKKHISKEEGRILTMREIFSHGLGFCMYTSDYESKGVEIVENTSEEIRGVVVEMVERLTGTWQPHADDEALQRRFREIFAEAMDNYQGRSLHGEIRARFGAHFLRNNRDWLK